jgi:hypothetical protein
MWDRPSAGYDILRQRPDAKGSAIGSKAKRLLASLGVAGQAPMVLLPRSEAESALSCHLIRLALLAQHQHHHQHRRQHTKRKDARRRLSSSVRLSAKLW